MMRKAIRGHLENNQALEKILPHIRGNVGFVFTKGDLNEVREQLLINKVRAPARAGAIAPCAVIIPAQNTGLGPEKTNFFQALSIPTKISKGTIEIINDVPILKVGDKVGASEATLLNMLNISPFSYGLQIEQVYDSGSIFSPNILDIKPEDLRAKFQQGVANVAALSLAIGYPTIASAPHSIANGFKNLLAVAAVTDVTFKEAETVKEYLKDPSKFAVAAAPGKFINILFNQKSLIIIFLSNSQLHLLLQPLRKKKPRRKSQNQNQTKIWASDYSIKSTTNYQVIGHHHLLRVNMKAFLM